MSKLKRQIKLVNDELRLVYARGESAVVGLVLRLLSRLDGLKSQLETLEMRSKKTSQNSNTSLSDDGLGKRTRNLRTKSDKSSGGQSGHLGSILKWSETVDWIDIYNMNTYSGCRELLRDSSAERWLARQVFDISAIERNEKYSDQQV